MPIFNPRASIISSTPAGISIVQGTTTQGANTYYGFTLALGVGFPSAIGSRTPTTFLGATIGSIYFSVNGGTFAQVILSGNRSQNFFSAALFEGTTKQLTSAADLYTYFATPNYTRWAWEIAKPAVWDGSGPTYIRLYP